MEWKKLELTNSVWERKLDSFRQQVLMRLAHYMLFKHLKNIDAFWKFKNHTLGAPEYIL